MYHDRKKACIFIVLGESPENEKGALLVSWQLWKISRTNHFSSTYFSTF